MIITIDYFDICCFRAMTQQLVVKWEVFTINICCFIATKILFQISVFTNKNILN